MHVMKVDPRALNENPDRSRQTRSTPQADLLLLATIKAVGIVQPPVIFPQADGGNGYVIDSGHRRVRQAIKAGLEEIDVIVVEASNDNGAMRSIVENTARDPLHPVDLWRAIERLVALSWTEEAIAIALSLTVRRVRQLRLMANVLPAMLDHMAKGDMPNEQQLRTIASASLDEQKEVWKANKPSKSDPRANWWGIANALSKTRMFAKDASFDDELARAYGIEWEEDLFGPADEDGRYTTNVEAYLGAQQEWMANNLPKRGIIAETGDYGDVKLPKKAERVYGKPTKSDHTAMYIDRQGKVQSVVYRMPEEKKAKGGDGDTGVVPTTRPDVTRKGLDMIGDLRTDALHEALARSPIEDDTLMALLVLAFAGMNVSVTSGASDASPYGSARLGGHAARLFNAEGAFAFDMDTLRIAVRSLLIDVLSCRSGRSKSGIVALVAGDAVGADGFLANMGTEEFLSCLSRPALEASCKDTSVLPRQKVKDTRAALVEHFAEGRFVHAAALFEPNAIKLANWLKDNEPVAEDHDEGDDDQVDHVDEADGEKFDEPFREAAE